MAGGGIVEDNYRTSVACFCAIIIKQLSDIMCPRGRMYVARGDVFGREEDVAGYRRQDVRGSASGDGG